MNGAKGLLESKTIWGALVTLAASGLAYAGYTMTPDDQAAVPELIAGVGGTLGSFLAIFGRIKASKKIG